MLHASYTSNHGAILHEIIPLWSEHWVSMDAVSRKNCTACEEEVINAQLHSRTVITSFYKSII